jgi:hypothetical protein
MPGPADLEALRLALELPETANSIARVARATNPEAAHWAFAQRDLRRRAANKFQRASDMFFTREALEQATHERVAAYHSSRFPDGQLAVDMTCGIGADLIALAHRGDAVGFDLDAERAWCAAANLPETGTQVTVIRGDSLLSLRRAPEYALADPARRVQGRRTLDLNEFSPSPFALRDYLAGSRLALLKLSPMIPDRDLAEISPHVEFVSFGGECREALVFLGRERGALREAVHLESGERIEPLAIQDIADQPRQYLFDVDPAAVRVGAVGRLAQLFGASGLGDSPGYLTGDSWHDSPWLRGYEIQDSGSFDAKRVRASLRNLDGYVFEIKSRAAGFDTSRLMRDIRHDGSEAFSLILWRQANSVRFALGRGKGRVAQLG